MTNNQPQDDKVTIQEMDEQELKMVLGWAKDEGWNPGRYDYAPYHAQDRHGFLLLRLNDKPVGAISVVKYSETFSFIGLFIVLAEHRGKGLGTQLWNKAIEKIATNSALGLYAVPKQISRYQRAGLTGHHYNHRYELTRSSSINVENKIEHSANSADMYQGLLHYDCRMWGASRKNMFDALLVQQSVFAFVTTDRNTGAVNGYGLIRPCVEGFRIGPIYADTKDSAKVLGEALITRAGNNNRIMFDIPSNNPFSTAFADYFNLERVDALDTLAMYKGDMNHQQEQYCYGVASLELG